jgi:bifunctional UDP-N-acetylglucosamine pyrophosphorylase / glucosamine-1-phosphate N-acetyltransferase
VGPYATLSAGSLVEEGASVGAYAELEDAVLGRGSRLGGHSYLGHCRVGRNAEIGCGFLTCGSGAEPGKLTVVEDDVFIGAASQVVGAVTIGRGSFVATGTSLTDDAPADSFVISRGRQVVKAGYARRHGGVRRDQ